MEERIGPGGRAGERPVQLHERERHPSQRADQQASERDARQERPPPTRILQEAPARNSHADHDAGNHQRRQHRRRRRDEPGPKRHQRIPGIERHGTVILEHHRLSPHHRTHHPEPRQAEHCKERTRKNASPRTPHDDHFGEDDRDEAVGADDVSRKDDAVQQAKGEHPPPAAANQTRGRTMGSALDTIAENLPLHRVPASAQFRGKSVQREAALAFDRARGHDRHAKTEENRKQRVGPAVDEQGPHQVPPLVGAAHSRERSASCLGSLREVSNPKGHIRQSNERKHEAARDVWCRETHLACARERQGLHEVLSLYLGKKRGEAGVSPGPRPSMCATGQPMADIIAC